VLDQRARLSEDFLCVCNHRHFQIELVDRNLFCLLREPSGIHAPWVAFFPERGCQWQSSGPSLDCA
jgi:hypothetical protein